jgi:hypothetical protein
VYAIEVSGTACGSENGTLENLSHLWPSKKPGCPKKRTWYSCRKAVALTAML